MIRNVWGKGQKTAVDRLLTTHHRIGITVQLMDLSHTYIGDLSDMLMGGQVDVDARASESTRQATLQLLDPKFQLHLDHDTPRDGSIFYTRMVKIIYSIYSLDNSQAYHFPLFCGPIDKVERSGVFINITAVGKEKLAMSTMWKAKTYKKGHKKGWLIRDILTDIAGEHPSKIRVPDVKAKAGKIVINRKANAWQAAKRIAASMNCQLYYDGRGIAQVRRRPNSTAFVFAERSSLLSEPSISYDVSTIVNAVEVVGGKPKGRKNKVRFRVVAPRNHPLSPWSMGRNNRPRFLPEVIENESVKSKKKARQLAKSRLKNALLEQVDVSFTSLVIPYLEEGDKVKVQSSRAAAPFRLQKFSIPLTAEGQMTVGFLSRVTPSKRFLKVRNKGKKKRGPNR